MLNVVFFVFDISAGGGTERVTSIIVNELATTTNYKLHVLSIQGNIENAFYKFHDSVGGTCLNKENESGIQKIASSIGPIRAFNQHNKTAVFITVESILALYSVPSLVSTSIKHIVWEHFNFNVDLGRPARRMARQLALAFADKVVTLTARDTILWKNGAWLKHAQLVHIPNPIFVPDSPSPSPVRSKTVISAGRLTHQKGFDLLVDAWHEISEESRKEWKLLIIGDGEDRQALQDKINGFDLAESILLIEATKNIFEYFKTASVYCLSSRYEGLPMVLLEALAFQLPIVAFDCNTGPEEIIDINKNGLLVKPGDTKMLASALEYLMTNEVAREQMSTFKSSKSGLFNLSSIIKQWRQSIE